MDSYHLDEPCLISFSGGRSSAYMLHQIMEAHGGIGPHRAIFANTGKEHEATLDFVEACSQRWGVPITWVEFVTPSQHAEVTHETASRNGEPFTRLINEKKMCPNVMMRFCTAELKVRPIDRASGGMQKAIGIRADEPRRIGRMRDQGNILPMVDAGATRADVHRFWRAQPFDLELPSDNGTTALGNCDLCFLKGKGILQSIIRREPERADWWIEAERLASDLSKAGSSVFSKRQTYQELKDGAQTDQLDMFDTQVTDCFCGD